MPGSSSSSRPWRRWSTTSRSFSGRLSWPSRGALKGWPPVWWLARRYTWPYRYRDSSANAFTSGCAGTGAMKRCGKWDGSWGPGCWGWQRCSSTSSSLSSLLRRSDRRRWRTSPMPSSLPSCRWPCSGWHFRRLPSHGWRTWWQKKTWRAWWRPFRESSASFSS